MSTIWKYTLDIGIATAINLSRNARVLHVGQQEGTVTIWISLDPVSTDVSERLYHIVGTGWSEENLDRWTHVGTAIVGEFVWHVFEEVT